MKIAFISLAVCLLIIGCSDDQPALKCNAENPIEDLAWLKAKIDERTAFVAANPNPNIGYYYYIAKWEGQEVILEDICCPVCDYIPMLYTCAGDRIEEFNWNDVVEKELLWRSENSPCAEW